MKKSIIVILLLLSIGSMYGFNNRSTVDDSKWNNSNDKIEAIANLYGYTRYYYPNKYAKKINWYKFLMHTLREAKKIDNSTDILAEFLYRSFSPLMPEMQIITSDKTFGAEPKRSGAASFYLMEHYGMGAKSILGIKVPYHSKIVSKKQSNELPVADSLYSYRLTDEITLRYPIAISRFDPSLKKNTKNIIEKIDTIDLRTTTSVIKTITTKTATIKPITAKDETLKIADIIVHWTVLRLFYPYLKEDGLDDAKMTELLLSYTQKAALTDDIGEYYLYVLREFMGNFKDQHIVLSSDFCGEGVVGAYLATHYNSIGLKYIDGEVVLSGNIKTHDNRMIDKGDLLISVNDVPTDRFLDEQLKYVSAATHKPKVEQLLYFGFPTLDPDSVMKYTFRKQNGDTVSYTGDSSGTYYENFSSEAKPRNESFIQDMGNGVFYVLLSSRKCTPKAFKQFLTNTPNISKIIFDNRQYPSWHALDILAFVAEKPVVWGDYRLPMRYFPEQDKTIWKENQNTILPIQPTIKAPIYFLISSSSTSYAESIANTVKKNGLGTLVGENTSGTNGDVGRANVRLFPFMLSIGKDFDGYHGKGVAPDIEVKQTLEDYIKGKDTILEYVLNL